MMAKCKNCIHNEVCDQSSRMMWAAMEGKTECDDFKDRSRYVVREKGEWIDIYGGKYDNPRYSCSHCGEKALYKFEVDVLGHEKAVQALTESCPNCGADMRKWENG